MQAKTKIKINKRNVHALLVLAGYSTMIWKHYDKQNHLSQTDLAQAIAVCKINRNRGI